MTSQGIRPTFKLRTLSEPIILGGCTLMAISAQAAAYYYFQFNMADYDDFLALHGNEPGYSCLARFSLTKM